MYFKDTILSESLADEYAAEFKENKAILSIIHNEFAKVYTKRGIKITDPYVNKDGDIVSEVKPGGTEELYNKIFSREKYPNIYKELEEKYADYIEDGYEISIADIADRLDEDILKNVFNKLGLKYDGSPYSIIKFGKLKDFPNTMVHLMGVNAAIITKPASKKDTKVISAEEFNKLDSKIAEINNTVKRILPSDWKNTIKEYNDSYKTVFTNTSTSKRTTKYYSEFYATIELKDLPEDDYRHYDLKNPDVKKFVSKQKTFMNKIIQFLKSKGFTVNSPTNEYHLQYSFSGDCIEGDYRGISFGCYFTDEYVCFFTTPLSKKMSVSG